MKKPRCNVQAFFGKNLAFFGIIQPFLQNCWHLLVKTLHILVHRVMMN